MSLDELLRYVQKTNPEMTKEKLFDELLVCRYSTNSLINTAYVQHNLSEKRSVSLSEKSCKKIDIPPIY